jgi:hypothetical protein
MCRTLRYILNACLDLAFSAFIISSTEVNNFTTFSDCFGTVYSRSAIEREIIQKKRHAKIDKFSMCNWDCVCNNHWRYILICFQKNRIQFNIQINMWQKKSTESEANCFWLSSVLTFHIFNKIYRQRPSIKLVSSYRRYNYWEKP